MSFCTVICSAYSFVTSDFSLVLFQTFKWPKLYGFSCGIRHRKITPLICTTPYCHLACVRHKAKNTRTLARLHGLTTFPKIPTKAPVLSESRPLIRPNFAFQTSWRAQGHFYVLAGGRSCCPSQVVFFLGWFRLKFPSACHQLMLYRLWTSCLARGWLYTSSNGKTESLAQRLGLKLDYIFH